MDYIIMFRSRIVGLAVFYVDVQIGRGLSGGSSLNVYELVVTEKKYYFNHTKLGFHAMQSL